MPLVGKVSARSGAHRKEMPAAGTVKGLSGSGREAMLMVGMANGLSGSMNSGGTSKGTPISGKANGRSGSSRGNPSPRGPAQEIGNGSSLLRVNRIIPGFPIPLRFTRDGRKVLLPLPRPVRTAILLTPPAK
jgi:hypothetical protein